MTLPIVAGKTFKAVNGQVRTLISLPEAKFRELEAQANEMGITVTHLVRMKLLGFETSRRAA